MNIDMLDTSTGTAEPCHHVLGRSTAISIFYLPLLSTSWIWVAWSVPTFGCLLAAVRNKGSACRTWRQLRGRWCLQIFKIHARTKLPKIASSTAKNMCKYRCQKTRDQQNRPLWSQCSAQFSNQRRRTLHIRYKMQNIGSSVHSEILLGVVDAQVGKGVRQRKIAII